MSDTSCCNGKLLYILIQFGCFWIHPNLMCFDLNPCYVSCNEEASANHFDTLDSTGRSNVMIHFTRSLCVLIWESIPEVSQIF